MVPGRRIVVAGCGPLLAAVAAKIVAGGGTVAAWSISRGPATGCGRCRRMATPAGSAARKGCGWALTLAAARVPVLFRHAVVGGGGRRGAATRVEVAPVDADGAPDRRRAALVRGRRARRRPRAGPGREIPKLLRARASLRRRARGGWVPVRDAFGRSSVAGLYAAGDGAGDRGRRAGAARRGGSPGWRPRTMRAAARREAFEREAGAGAAPRCDRRDASSPTRSPG